MEEMESFYKAVAMLTDGIGFIISISLIYYHFYFRNKNERNTQAPLPFLVAMECILEFFSIMIRGNDEYSTVYMVLAYIQSFVEISSVCLTLQLLLENMPFLKKVRAQKGFRVAFIYFAICYVITYPISDVYDLIFYKCHHPFDIWTCDYLGDVSLIGILLILLISIILRVLCRIKKDKASRHYVDTIYFVLLIFIIIDVWEAFIIPEWNVSAPGMALGYSFFFTISNTKYLMAGKEKEAMLQADLNMAQRIQQDALPKNQPAFVHHKDVIINSMMVTAKDVGGDFYDYFEIDEDHHCFLMADVSGKGMPASLFMMTAKTMIKTLALQLKDTAEVMRKADEMLVANNESMLFVTVWIGILNTKTLEIEYTNAGHNPPVLIHSDGSLEMIKSVDGTAVGTGMKEPFVKSTMKVHTGDRLFLYTDGVPESHNVKEELFGDERMLKELAENYKDPGDELVKKLKAQVDDFAAGRDPFDDVTMMVVDFNLLEEADDSACDFSFLDAL